MSIENRQQEQSKNECSCRICRTACETKPGWFLPGEAEKAAEYLGLSISQFFKQYLLVDWYEDDEFVLSPAIKESAVAGKEFPADPRGTCIFYRDGKCEIHPVKPFECRELFHDDTKNVADARHMLIAQAWYNDKDACRQIRKLLGRKPVAEISSS